VFIGEVDATKAHGIHGLDYENEDIRVHVLSRETAYQWVKDGKFENGASIIALQWLQLNHEELKSQWGVPPTVENE
jgi:ADP-ribose pyrophosphatase